MLILKRYKYTILSALFASFMFVMVSPFTPLVHASTPDRVDFNDKSLTFTRVNRTVITLGEAFFYSADPSGDNYVYNSVGLKCPATLTYTPQQSGSFTIPSTWKVEWTSPYESKDGCQTVKSSVSRYDDPKNNGENERYWTIFYKDGNKINSVLKDNTTTFTKKGAFEPSGTPNQDVYIEDGVQATDCPSVIRYSAYDSRWVYIPMAKASSGGNASDQYASLMNRVFNITASDIKCTSTDQDNLGLFKKFGLPESYYDRGLNNRNDVTTDFGFRDAGDHSQNGVNVNIFGAVLLGGIPSKQEAQGIAANGDYSNGAGIGNGGGVSSSTSSKTPTSETSCAVSWVGWFVCPVSNFLSGLADGAMGILSKSFEIQAQKLFDTSSSNQAYVAWQQVRNYANIVFVIAFLIIIFSQITSIGVTNYGIKKLLPKLIVTAILVNVSFPICALLVDLSNLLGYGLATFLGSSITVTSQTSSDPLSSGNTFTGIISALLIGAAAGAFAIFSLAAVIGVILSVVVIGVTMVVLLGVRQALVVLLIVLAPLAFVAMLLPNTQPLFKKWFKMLKSMLLIFPVASLLYGGGTLARNVLYATSSSDIVKALAASLPVIALVGVYKLFMSSMTSLDNIGGALGNLRNGIGRGGKALRGASDKAIENSSYGQFGKYREREASRRRAMIQGGTYAGRGGKLNPRNWGSSAHKAFNSSGLSGNFGNIQAASGAAVVSAQDKEYLENAGARLDGFQYKDSGTGNTMTLSQNQMMDMALGNDVKDSSGRTIVGSHEIDEHMQRAAIQRAAKIATVEQAETLATATSSSKMSASVRKTISESLAGSGTLARAPYLSGKALGQMQDGSFDLKQAALDAVRAGKVKPESLVAMDDTAAKTIFKAVNSTAPGSNERNLLKAAADGVYSSSQLLDKVVTGSGLDKQLNDMKSL